MRAITARSVIVAMNFITPSHFGHFSVSMPHTRCSSVAQSMRVLTRDVFVGVDRTGATGAVRVGQCEALLPSTAT